MDARNLNELMKADPSLEDGEWNLLFERKCSVEMKIIEPSILAMVPDDISTTEDLNFKVLSKSKPVSKGVGRLQMTSEPQSERLQDAKLPLDETEGLEEPIVGEDPHLLAPADTFDADLNPDKLRLELFSDTDYFFQYVYE